MTDGLARIAPSRGLASASANAKRAHLLTMLALALATLAAYAQIRHHSFLTYDDPDYVLQNPNLRVDLGWAEVHQAFIHPFPIWDWVPLTSLSLQVDYALHGLDPSGYLLSNLALHVLATLVLYAAFVQMTGARGRSAFVAGVFALHPLHVESVAWASERKDVLSGLFFALALWAYAWYAERPRSARLLVVTLCLLLGLLSKSTLVTLPAVFLLLDWWPLGRLGAWAPAGSGMRVTLRRSLLEKIPMLLLVAGVAGITFVFGRAAGAMFSLGALPLGVRVGNALESYLLYVAKSFWPSGLAVIYPLSVAGPPLAQNLAAASFLILVSLFVARHTRTRPYLAVGWLCVLGMLVPTIGLAQAGMQARADRFMYLPLVGTLDPGRLGACDVLDRLHARRLARPAALAVIASLWICTWLQVRHRQDSFTLFQHALEVTEDNAIAHLNLGSAFLATGDADAAERHFTQAAALDPAGCQRGSAWRMRSRCAASSAARSRPTSACCRRSRTTRSPRVAMASPCCEPGAPRKRSARSRSPSRPTRAPHRSMPRSRSSTQNSDAGGTRSPGIEPRCGSIRPTREPPTTSPGCSPPARMPTPEEREESVRLAEHANGCAIKRTLPCSTRSPPRTRLRYLREGVAVAARAASLAEASGNAQLAGEIRARGAHYASHRAWVDPAPPGQSDSAASPANAPEDAASERSAQ